MRGTRRILWDRVAKPLTFGLAIVCLVFLLQVAPHGHANHQDDPACLLCQVAHLGVTPAVTAVTFSIPLVPLDKVSAPKLGAETESFFWHAPSRAPPSLLP